MAESSLNRPRPGDYPSYFDRYIPLVPGSDVVSALTSQGDAMPHLISGIPDTQAAHRYAPGKWSVAEVLGHIVDVERMLAYWLWCFTRNDGALRPSVDCEAYVREAHFDERSLASLCDEYQSVRSATLAYVSTVRPALFRRTGLAGGGEITALAILYVIAGHELHHVQMLADRYGIHAPDAATR